MTTYPPLVKTATGRWTFAGPASPRRPFLAQRQRPSIWRDLGRCGGPRIPLRPLVDGAAVAVGLLAELVDVPARTLQRWLQEGVTWAQADELAVRAGYHPAEIWPDWFDLSTTP